MAGLRSRRKLSIIVGLVLLYLLLKRGYQTREYELFIPKQEPKTVWNVVADFSNLAKLNTRIDRWELLDESGNFDRWTYRVISYETMIADWLFGLNENHGDILVEPIAAPDHYYMQEVYTTYSFHGWLTIKNQGIFNFKRSFQNGQAGTHILHDVSMNCPLLLGPVCKLETDLNRREFLKNLENWFK
ncbi:hypothetical protein SK128_003610 [Halocaridina rubra]|uniref:Uncharacterized protein n=1 Tax=Halocaridina rubra TaxID=373956 RepID=A0AAN8WJI5_HALRR